MAQTVHKNQRKLRSWNDLSLRLYSFRERQNHLRAGHFGYPEKMLIETSIVNAAFIRHAENGEIFRTPEDWEDLQRRLRAHGFSDDLTVWQLGPGNKDHVTTNGTDTTSTTTTSTTDNGKFQDEKNKHVHSARENLTWKMTLYLGARRSKLASQAKGERNDPREKMIRQMTGHLCRHIYKRKRAIENLDSQDNVSPHREAVLRPQDNVHAITQTPCLAASDHVSGIPPRKRLRMDSVIQSGLRDYFATFGYPHGLDSSSSDAANQDEKNNRIHDAREKMIMQMADHLSMNMMKQSSRVSVDETYAGKDKAPPRHREDASVASRKASNLPPRKHLAVGTVVQSALRDYFETFGDPNLLYSSSGDAPSDRRKDAPVQAGYGAPHQSGVATTSTFTTSTQSLSNAPSSVPATPHRNESFHDSPIDGTKPGNALIPSDTAKHPDIVHGTNTTSITSITSTTMNDITQEDNEGELFYVQKVPTVSTGTHSSMDKQEVESTEPMDMTITTTRAVPNKPKKRKGDESQKPESTSMTISVEDTATAVIPQVQNEYTRHFRSVLITLAVLSIFFPVILWTLLGSDEQYKIPLRTCLSMDTIGTTGPPRYHDQPGTMDHVTFADSNNDHEPWLGREGDGVSSCRMMTMSNIGSNYLRSPWYGVMSITLGILLASTYR